VIEVRAATSAEEVRSAVALLDVIFAGHRGYLSNRDRRVQEWTVEPGLLAVALDDSRVVGVVGCGANGGIGTVGVDAAYRRHGMARQLMEQAEDILRSRGETEVGLGSVDESVDFYLKCGYVPQLLVQFDADVVEDRDAVIQQLIDGPLREHEVERHEWQGHPQLWLQERTIDFGFKARIEAVAPGVVAQYVMSKRL
jgi:GNAT superfamily N-acetyltransferase